MSASTNDESVAHAVASVVQSVAEHPRRSDQHPETPYLDLDRSTESPLLLEACLPYRELSQIARADRRARDPAYIAHRWWARRPPSVMRGLILAAALPADTPADEYWKAFESGSPCLQGLRVHDMFAGGGSVLVEAARLGAAPSGTDVDPLAVKIIQHELDPPDATQVKIGAAELLTFLEEKVGSLYASTRRRWRPLHYFYLHEVTCPSCQTRSPLYKNLVIARDLQRKGGVVRDHSLVVFCPDCFKIHCLKDGSRTVLRCCKQRPLSSGTFSAHRFTCPKCGVRSAHKQLKTAKSPRRLLAIEETNENASRRIRAPDSKDRAQLESAAAYVVSEASHIDTPSGGFSKKRVDSRPLSLGVDVPSELFTHRQLAVFGHAFRWLRTSERSTAIVRALGLAISNALTTNNRLCGYATDYGRLAPLFSVRSYSLPALSVELNPFHPTAGRGTLIRTLDRVVRSVAKEVRRYVWSKKLRRPTAVTTTYKRGALVSGIRCASASEPVDGESRDIDICIFDPPYFDYIAYSELSEFYRAWWREHELGGSPLLPSPTEPVISFGRELGKCLRAALARLKASKPLVFTYHSSASQAWDAIGLALDEAELMVTALWPVLNDAHMGHHTADGNCEWDVVVVCRRAAECERSLLNISTNDWKANLRPLRISKADQASMKRAIQMARGRYGSPRSNRRG